MGTITGCVYESTIDLSNYTYMVINETLRQDIPPSYLLNHHLINPVKNLLVKYKRFPDFPLSSIIKGGIYQCAIYDPHRMSRPVMSKKSAFVTLSGM